MVEVRTATPEDTTEIARVHTVALREQGTDHYDEGQLDALAPTDAGPEDVRDNVLGDDRYTVVAEADDEVIGFGGVRLDDGSLLGIFVDPEYGGRGVGAAIIDAVEAHAREAGLETLSVFAALNAAGFYEACGFERVGRRDARGREGPIGTYESGDEELPAIEMRKEL